MFKFNRIEDLVVKKICTRSSTRTVNRRHFQPITPEMNDVIETHLSLPSSKKYVVNIHGIWIERSDMELFKPGEWFSDNIINSCLRLITSDYPQTFAFNTWFIDVLTTQGYSDMVQRQVNTLDRERTGELFNQRLVLVPVNPREIHWSVVAINMLEKSIIYYDSLQWRNQVILKLEIEQFLINYIFRLL